MISGYAIYPTHRDDHLDAEARNAPPWIERGPKWQPFGQRGQALAALRHEDRRAKIVTVPDGVEPDELAGDGWEVVAVVKPYEEEKDVTN